MRHARSDSTETEDESSNEQDLRREVEELRQKLYEHRLLLDERTADVHATPKAGRPSSVALWGLALFALVLAAIAFFAGYPPRQRQEATVAAEVSAAEQAAPRALLATVEAYQGSNRLVLPGNKQALREE